MLTEPLALMWLIGLTVSNLYLIYKVGFIIGRNQERDKRKNEVPRVR